MEDGIRIQDPGLTAPVVAVIPMEVFGFQVFQGCVRPHFTGFFEA
jgi:hypothetical protein